MLDLFTVLNQDWERGGGKETPHIWVGLAAPSAFPSSLCLALKFSITEVPHWAKEIRGKPWGPLPHRTQHTPFQKRTGWRTKGWTFAREWRHCLMGGGDGRNLIDLFFGEQKDYVRICTLGVESYLTSVPTISRLNVNASPPGPLTWKLGAEIWSRL